jgi:hypothetical protein
VNLKERSKKATHCALPPSITVNAFQIRSSGILSGGAGNLAKSLSGLSVLCLSFDSGARTMYVAGV